MRWAGLVCSSHQASKVQGLVRSWAHPPSCHWVPAQATTLCAQHLVRTWSTSTQQQDGTVKQQAVQGRPVFSSLRMVATFAAGMATVGAYYLSTRPTSPPVKPAPSPPTELQPAGDPLLQAVTELAQSEELVGPASSNSTPAPAETITSSSRQLSGPWVTDEELSKALQRRALSENRLRGYLHVKQRQVQTWIDQAQVMGRMTREQFEKEMMAVEDEVNLQTNLILYGINDPNARRDYLQQFGCTKWTDEALKVIASHGPVLELGAGLGHWQKQLADKGVDVAAFDDMSALPVHDVRVETPQFVGKVDKGDEQMVKQHPKRTLLIVYPGPTAMAVKALKLYKGNTLLYVGESRGGVNATDEFFDALEQGWELAGVAAVEPFPEGYEKLWVLRRKGRKDKGWLW